MSEYIGCALVPDGYTGETVAAGICALDGVYYVVYPCGWIRLHDISYYLERL